MILILVSRMDQGNEQDVIKYLVSGSSRTFVFEFQMLVIAGGVETQCEYEVPNLDQSH